MLNYFKLQFHHSKYNSPMIKNQDNYFLLIIKILYNLTFKLII